MKKKGRKGLKEAHKFCVVEQNDNNSFKVKGKIWIEGKNGTFIGYGRVVLLERIEKYGSISKAAKSMNMSYRHAWKLIDSMNRQSTKPFIETQIGGKGGGGAWLTETGKKAIDQFWKIHDNLKNFIAHETDDFRL